MKNAQDFDVRILSPKEMKNCSPRTVELVLRPQNVLKDFKSAKAMIAKSDSRWSQQLLRQLEERLLVLWKDKKDSKLKVEAPGTIRKKSTFKVGESDSFKSISVHFEGGGRSIWTSVPADLE
ncbi:MAG: hypothetical protein K2X47_04780, partial [Bdellovibrionales bacterium]|nr:hypothetical protein [Bdellovibrionales bacterium]